MSCKEFLLVYRENFQHQNMGGEKQLSTLFSMECIYRLSLPTFIVTFLASHFSPLPPSYLLRATLKGIATDLNNTWLPKPALQAKDYGKNEGRGKERAEKDISFP